MQQIIVDGYNVMHADPALRLQLEKDIEAARGALISRLDHYVQQKQVKMTVVFDGRGGLADSAAIIPGRLQVVYTPTGQSADQFIVETVAGHPSARSYIVVTSDMVDIGRRLRGLGAQVMTSPAFLDRLRRRPPGDAPESGNDAVEPLPEEDLAYWMKQFGVDNDASDTE